MAFQSLPSYVFHVFCKDVRLEPFSLHRIVNKSGTIVRLHTSDDLYDLKSFFASKNDPQTIVKHTHVLFLGGKRLIRLFLRTKWVEQIINDTVFFSFLVFFFIFQNVAENLSYREHGTFTYCSRRYLVPRHKRYVPLYLYF